MTNVLEINDPDDLAGYRLLWNSLLPQTRGATFFQSYDWLASFWRHHGNVQRLRVLVVYADDRPIGILPLAVVREQTRVGTIRVLTYPLHGWGTFYGPIGPDPTATLWAGLRYIQQSDRDWDLCDLRWVDADGPDAGRTGRAMCGAGLPAEKKPWMQSAQIDLPADWNSYWNGLKRNWRQNVERSERRLAECGKLTYIRYRPAGSACDDGDPRWDLYEQCESIARNSWQGSATDGTTLTHESVRVYLRDAHQTAAEAGGLDLNLLLIGGSPAAFAYNYHYNGQVYGLRAGYDSEVARDGSGTVLLRKMIENSCARGDIRIDLGPDSLDYKRNWYTHVQTCYHYPYYSPTVVKAQVLRVKRWLTERLAATASQ